MSFNLFIIVKFDSLSSSFISASVLFKRQQWVYCCKSLHKMFEKTEIKNWQSRDTGHKTQKEDKTKSKHRR
jgi:hypothetical protein